AVMPNGDLVAGGSFSTAGLAVASHIARWDGANWHSLGSRVDGDVYALHALPSGELGAGGDFGHAGGTTADAIAKWNGVTWCNLGLGFMGPLFGPDIYAITSLQNSDLAAGGNFTAAGGAPAYNLALWHPM